MAIEIQGLTKVFAEETHHEVVALQGIDLSLESGKTYGLIGPNGAGKTTLLRILVGVIPPSEGSISIFGMDLRERAREIRGRLGFLSPTTGLYARMTSREILHYFGTLSGMTAEEAAARVAEVSVFLDIGDLLEKKIEVLSHGQRQRVNIARTMIHDPDLYIFDEPTDGLDLMTSRTIVRFIRFLKQSGKLIVISTHDLPLAEKLCDRFVFIHKGRILATGSSIDLERETGTHGLEEAFLAMARTRGDTEEDELDPN